VTDRPSASAPESGGLTVHPKGFLFPWLLLPFKPLLSVDDGEPQSIKWAANFLPVPPGQHTLRCYVPYLFGHHLGDSTTEVDLSAGVSTLVEWKSPWHLSRQGGWKVVTPD
jgi:hypothetical protein